MGQHCVQDFAYMISLTPHKEPVEQHCYYHLPLRKLRLGNVKRFVQGLTASKRWNQSIDPGLAPKSYHYSGAGELDIPLGQESKTSLNPLAKETWIIITPHRLLGPNHLRIILFPFLDSIAKLLGQRKCWVSILCFRSLERYLTRSLKRSLQTLCSMKQVIVLL